ncbi:MAG TPA: GAF domain-containing protein [Terriglobales bacterium]|nr:GAF domain-containing protein [Terriglobales bacterium]
MDGTPKIGFYGRERRRAPRRKVYTPAYASLNGSSLGAPQELCEILNISESGTCIQTSTPLKVNRLVPLVLDLSETGSRVHTAGHVVWAESSGKVGIRFPELPEVSLQQLQKWMEVNESAMKTDDPGQQPAQEGFSFLRPTVCPWPSSAAGYTSLIAEWAEIQKEVELFGPNLDPALHLIAERASALTWAGGATIALVAQDSTSDLVCVARTGNDAPELGARLDTCSGFSGECVRSGVVVKCDDTETDARDENGSYRAIGIRSVLACPIRASKSGLIGILEVFSPEPAAFWDNDTRTLERLARIVAKAVEQTNYTGGKTISVVETREMKAEEPPNSIEASENPFARLEDSTTARNAAMFASGIIAVIFAVWFTAPWISDAMNGFISPPKSQAAESAPASVDYIGMSLGDLRKIALQGSPSAQYSIALRYASGDGVTQDYHEALGWFLKAAENGNFRAPAKIASCFWAGKGTQQDYSRAYFWGLLAQAAGDDTGRVIVISSAPHLSDHQRRAEQQEADKWLHSHRSSSPRASR